MSKNPPIASDDLLDELTSTMPQGVPTSTQPAADDDGFGELEALLDESLETIREREQYKADLKARSRNFVGMSREEVDFCNSRMAAFELARVWQADGAVSVWAIYHCANCGRDRMVFSRLMEHQQHRHVATTHRWITVQQTTFEAMPVKEIREVGTCPRCSEWELDPRLMTDIKEVLE